MTIFSVAAFGQPETDKPVQSVKLSGGVVDPNGAAVSNAQIRFMRGRLSREIKADENGNYEIMLPPGKYSVRIWREQFRSGKQTVRLDAKENVARKFVLMPRTKVMDDKYFFAAIYRKR